MLICCVKACRHKKHANSCRLHRLPKNVEICKKWVRVIGEEDLLQLDVHTLHSIKYLCSCHFTDKDYRTPERKYLLPDAVPMQFSEATQPIENKRMKIFMSQTRLKTTAILEPLGDIRNVKAKTLRQRKEMPVDNLLCTAEDSEGLHSANIIKRTHPDQDHETTLQNSRSGMNSVKRSRTSEITNGKSTISDSHIKNLNNRFDLSCNQIDGEANLNQGNRGEESGGMIEREHSPKILKSNLRLKNLEKLCNSLKAPVVDALMCKVDLLLNYYDKPENYSQPRK